MPGDAKRPPTGGLWDALSRDWSSWIRVVSAVVVSLLFGIVAPGAVVWWLVAGRLQVEVTFTEGGATLVSLGGEPRQAILSLPAAARWMNTGITVEPGATIAITASGYTNPAVHRLVQAAHADSLPNYGWLDAEGRSARPSRVPAAHRDRNPLAIYPGAPIGAVIGYLQVAGGAEPSVINPSPPGVLLIGAEERITHGADEDIATLWLAVNDIMLTEDSRDAYIGVDDDMDALDRGRRERRWAYIEQHQYWDLWWDDNVGSLVIQIQFQDAA